MKFSITKHEARKPDQRPIPNTYYYLDYKIFVDVVKYKIHKMGKKLDANMQQVQNEEKKTTGILIEYARTVLPAC